MCGGQKIFPQAKEGAHSEAARGGNRCLMGRWMEQGVASTCALRPQSSESLRGTLSAQGSDPNTRKYVSLLTLGPAQLQRQKELGVCVFDCISHLLGPHASSSAFLYLILGSLACPLYRRTQGH